MFRAIGSIHTYHWVVPHEHSENMRVRDKKLATTARKGWPDPISLEQ